MNRLFFSNFDCEYIWTAPEKVPPPSVRRRNHELFAVWLSVADEKDVLLQPPGVEPGFWEYVASSGLSVPRLLPLAEAANRSKAMCGVQQFVPWGWTPSAVRRAHKTGCPFSAPPQAIVRQLNSRRFSFQLEEKWHCGLPHAALVASTSRLLDAISIVAKRYGKWIIKAEWGMAGREQVRGEGETVPLSIQNWARKRLRQKQTLFVEPQVKIVTEVGLQFTIPRDGSPQLNGITPLMSNQQGNYRGSRFDLPAEEPYRSGTIESRFPGWQKACRLVFRAARQMQQRGYFGQAGIDAAFYRLPDGVSGWRPLQDINARWTMGHLSLGFRRLLGAGEAGHWLHQRWPAASADAVRKGFSNFCRSLPGETRFVRTSPFVVDDKPVSLGSVVVMGADVSAGSLSPPKIAG